MQVSLHHLNSDTSPHWNTPFYTWSKLAGGDFLAIREMHVTVHSQDVVLQLKRVIFWDVIMILVLIIHSNSILNWIFTSVNYTRTSNQNKDIIYCKFCWTESAHQCDLRLHLHDIRVQITDKCLHKSHKSVLGNYLVYCSQSAWSYPKMKTPLSASSPFSNNAKAVAQSVVAVKLFSQEQFKINLVINQSSLMCLSHPLNVYWKAL